MKRMQMNTRQITAGLLALALSVQLTACGTGSTTGLVDEPGHGRWIDSDVAGFVQPDDEFRLQDDFAAAANKETILDIQAQNPLIWATDTAAADLIQARYRELLRDDSITGPNAEVIRTFEHLVFDWDARDSLGVEPIRRYIDDIQRISSIEELTAYQASPERNPFNLGLLMPGGVQAQELFVDRSTLVLKIPNYTLGNRDSYLEYEEGALELKEIMDETISYLMGRLGYDEKSIRDTLRGCYEIEQFLAANECMSLYNRFETLYQVQTDRAGLELYTNGYPLFEILDGRGFSQADSFHVDYMLLSRLNGIYDQAHLQALKSYFTVHMLLFGYPMLDRETIDRTQEIGASRSGQDDGRTREKTEDQEFSTTTVNCFYRPERNSIFIMAGFVAIGDVIYGDAITDEEFMGSIGAVAGHEISHGFDGKSSHYDLYGRRYDDNGNETDWMSTEDRSRLDERVGRAGSYFSLARPIPGQRQVEGISVMNEATADMAGIKAILYMARDMEDFDYDSFFRVFAALYVTQTQEKFELETIEEDDHPLSFHRVNITLQQFDEFLETYDIQPGDGMYLDPDKRISVW